MKTEEQIKAKIADMEKYLSIYHNISYETGLGVLINVLTSTDEDINKYHDYLVEKVGPVETYDQRQALKKKQEEFYEKNLRGRSRTSKKYEELFEQWKNMDVLEYDDYLWGAYHAMRWLFDEEEWF